MALEMCSALAECDRDGTGLRVRIGIATGPLVAGVIGGSKFTYDLWRHRQHCQSHGISGEPGRIHVTERVRSELLDEFEFTPRGELPIKGKGPMSTYFLERRV